MEYDVGCIDGFNSDMWLLESEGSMRWDCDGCANSNRKG